MQIFRRNSLLLQKLRQVFGHFFGERRDQNSFFFGHHFFNFQKHILDLSLGGFDFQLRIKQARWANDLLRDFGGMFFFKNCRCGRSENHLIDARFKFFKFQRPIVQRTWQTKTIFNQRRFPSLIASIHGPDLRNSHVRFIHHHQKIFGKIVNQGVRRFARLALRQKARIIFNSIAKTHLPHHFQILPRAPRNSFRFQQLAIFFELRNAAFHFRLDFSQRFFHHHLRHHKMLGWKNQSLFQLRQFFARQKIKFDYFFHLSFPQFNSDNHFSPRRYHFNRITSNSEFSTRQHVTALILHIHHALHNFLSSHFFANFNFHRALAIIVRRAQAIDARNGSHNDHISP